MTALSLYPEQRFLPSWQNFPFGQLITFVIQTDLKNVSWHVPHNVTTARPASFYNDEINKFMNLLWEVSHPAVLTISTGSSGLLRVAGIYCSSWRPWAHLRQALPSKTWAGGSGTPGRPASAFRTGLVLVTLLEQRTELVTDWSIVQVLSPKGNSAFSTVAVVQYRHLRQRSSCEPLSSTCPAAQLFSAEQDLKPQYLRHLTAAGCSISAEASPVDSSICGSWTWPVGRSETLPGPR